MKKILTVILAALMLFSALPAAFAQGEARGIELDPMSALKIDGENGYVENFCESVSVGALLSNFKNKNSLTVTDPEGNVLSLSDDVGSDYVISLGDSSLKTLIPGDADRNAKVTVKDAFCIVKDIAGLEQDFVRGAADVNCDGKLNVQDAIVILKKVAGWNVQLGSDEANGIVSAPEEDEDISVLYDSIMHRVPVENVSPSDDHTYTVRMAKNELEGVQIFLTSETEKKGLTLEIGDIVNADGDVLEAEHRYGYYYKIQVFNQISGGDTQNYVESMFTDPLPKLVNPIDLNANESRAFYVKVKTTPETKAGLYKASLTLKDADGNVVKSSEFRVYVWDFALDEETACDTAFHASSYNIIAAGKKAVEDPDEVLGYYIGYYDFMLENRLSAYHMPYDAIDERANEYMSNPRVTSFCVAGGSESYDGDDAKVIATYEKLRTNPEWLDKAYLYTVDEPSGYGGLERVKNQWEWACSILPEKDFYVVIPLTGNMYYSELGMDAIEFVSSYCNMWCPQTYAFKPFVPGADRLADREKYPYWMFANYNWDSRHTYNIYGQFRYRYESFRERGDKMWWYICCAPEFPHPNFFQSYQGCNVRLVLWQQYMLDIDGLLYWHVNYWDGVNRKFTNGGDGLLIYSGHLFGEEYNPVPSVRLECLRDGIEDFQYFTQLERLTDRATSEEYTNRITTEILRFTEDYGEYVKVREEAGYQIEALSTMN